MVLVRTETGQLVMVPQQVLAQAQAKTQQGQTVVTQRPATPTAGATIRVSTTTVGLVLRTRFSAGRVLKHRVNGRIFDSGKRPEQFQEVLLDFFSFHR